MRPHRIDRRLGVAGGLLRDCGSLGHGAESPSTCPRCNWRAPQFASSVAQALSSSGLAPHRLELEITETTLLAEGNETLDGLRQLRDIGVKVALDDFGTGYSSLSYLRRFPFDTIKIDRSFVQDMDRPDTAAIVHAIIDLAGRLRMSTIAEGVETEEQLQRLRTDRCDMAQGYLIGKPVGVEEAFAPRALALPARTLPDN